MAHDWQIALGLNLRALGLLPLRHHPEWVALVTSGGLYPPQITICPCPKLDLGVQCPVPLNPTEQLSGCWVVGAMAPPQWEVEQGRKGQRCPRRGGTMTLGLGYGPMEVSGSPHRARGLCQNTVTSWGHLLAEGGVARGEPRVWDTAGLGLRMCQECSSRVAECLAS